MKRRQVLATLGSVAVAGCTAPSAGCPSLDFEGEEVCPAHELDVELEIEPATVTLPAELTFTVTNETDRRFVFPPERFPIVYRRSSSDWEQVPIERRFGSAEPVSVSDTYAFTQEYPFYRWAPEPGRHLLLFAGRLETTGGERTRRINLVDAVSFRT